MNAQEDLLSYMVLRRVRAINPLTLTQLDSHPGRMTLALNGDLRDLPAKQANAVRAFLQDRKTLAATWAQAEQHLAWLRERKVRTLHRSDPDYPQALKAIPDPPIWLFVKGAMGSFHKPAIAVVGSRNCSAFARDLARTIGCELGASGLTVVSGLARGIDTAAHQGALNGEGSTLAVFGSGLDRVYPAENRSLALAIQDKGACISEYPPGMRPWAIHFPQRNRIIAGLSLGVMVVEATVRSGSLITARLALEYGREVFAVPGSVISDRVRGCHRLIKQGAKLVENMQDVVDELPMLCEYIGQRALRMEHEGPPPAKPCPPDKEARQLLDLFADQTLGVDELVAKLQRSPPELLGLLTELELEGRIVRAGHGYRISRQNF